MSGGNGRYGGGAAGHARPQIPLPNGAVARFNGVNFPATPTDGCLVFREKPAGRGPAFVFLGVEQVAPRGIAQFFAEAQEPRSSGRAQTCSVGSGAVMTHGKVNRIKLQEERNALMKTLGDEKVIPPSNEVDLYQNSTRLSPRVHVARRAAAERPKRTTRAAAARAHGRE
jgi:hypothetical protein